MQSCILERSALTIPPKVLIYHLLTTDQQHFIFA